MCYYVSHSNKSLFTWHLFDSTRFYLCSAWFSDGKISTCYLLLLKPNRIVTLQINIYMLRILYWYTCVNYSHTSASARPPANAAISLPVTSLNYIVKSYYNMYVCELLLERLYINIIDEIGLLTILQQKSKSPSLQV